MGIRIGAAALVLGLTLVARSQAGTFAMESGVPQLEAGALQLEGGALRLEAGALAPAYQKTTKDKIYTKEQAARGSELYVKYCEKCHTPEKVPEGKKPGPPVIGQKFLDTWADRTLGELFGTILNTMPSDGSAVLTADQALDAVAHILQANGFPEGGTPLKNDDAMKAVLIVK